MYHKCLVLKAKGSRLSTFLFINGIFEHEKTKVCKAMLHGKYREIMNVCNCHPIIFTK